jgi:hypothetical protein
LDADADILYVKRIDLNDPQWIFRVDLIIHFISNIIQNYKSYFIFSDIINHNKLYNNFLKNERPRRFKSRVSIV